MRVQPPKGFRDFTPEVMLLRKKVIASIEKVFQRYGFDPIDTPAIEYWEVLAGKYGGEAESKLIWRFTDPWSKRVYALRYDLTVPLARYYASHRNTPLPFKRYHIGPVWRHEEPQRGRYREFYQCDADIVGSPYPEADAEILNLVIDIFSELGFSGYVIRLNDRRMLAGIFEESLGISNVLPVYRVIDKLDKIGSEGVKRELRQLGLSDSIVDGIMDIVSIKGSPDEILDYVEKRYGRNKNVMNAVSCLNRILGLVKDLSKVNLDLSLVRGLDYYTGPIHEVVLTEFKFSSLAGGGRYDNLIGMFIGVDVPATGVSIGIERVIDVGLELGLFDLKVKSVTQVYVVYMDERFFDYAWHVADKLRSMGFNVRIDIMRRPEDKQRKDAKRLNVPVIAFIGEREYNSNMVTLYVRETSERVSLKVNEVKDYLSKILG